MNLLRSIARSTLGVSRRAIGLPLLLERLALVQDKLERLALVPDKLERLASSEAQSRRTNGGNPWDAYSYGAIMGYPAAPETAPGPVPLKSGLCRQGDFALDAYRYWMHAIKRTPRFHRKQWELFFVAQALHERGKLAPGCRGLAFGVGQEPLPALFASLGCDVLATDQDETDAIRAGWAQTGQHVTGISALNSEGLCEDAVFEQRVAFRCVDMNAIPSDLAEQFDFCWSTCSFEHLGSLEHGMRFVEESIETLKVGGVAVHTTEFNLSSNSDTIETRDLSIYRRRDIEALIERLQRRGCHVEPIEWKQQTGFVDDYVDYPPFKKSPHLRLRLGNYDCTSIGLIITRR